MKNENCKCPYLPCEFRGNCIACIEKNKKTKEIPNCMEEIAIELGAKLPCNKPETEIYKDKEEMSRRCAQLVKECLEKKPNSLLCFPAGSTVIKTCEILKEMQKKGEIDFSKAEFVALDEWLDLKEDGENCSHFLKKHLYDALGILSEKVYLFDVHAADMDAECKRIDQIIFKRGGIDLMLLGLGMNGHLGLNEPGDSFDSYSKIVTLSETTQNIGQKYFLEPMKLTRGITLGIRHMFETKKVILQVAGKEKQDIVYQMYQSRPSISLPGTVMKLLENALVVLDEGAAQKINSIDIL